MPPRWLSAHLDIYQLQLPLEADSARSHDASLALLHTLCPLLASPCLELRTMWLNIRTVVDVGMNNWQLAG